VTASSEDEPGDPGGYRRDELARWIDIELDRILRPPVDDVRYRAAITEVAMIVLVDLLEHSEHRALPRRKDGPGDATLYRTLTASARGIFGSHVTDMMWDTSTQVADAVLAHLAAGE
jgi:hypothetical protein